MKIIISLPACLWNKRRSTEDVRKDFEGRKGGILWKKRRRETSWKESESDRADEWDIRTKKEAKKTRHPWVREKQEFKGEYWERGEGFKIKVKRWEGWLCLRDQSSRPPVRRSKHRGPAAAPSASTKRRFAEKRLQISSKVQRRFLNEGKWGQGFV